MLLNHPIGCFSSIFFSILGATGSFSSHGSIERSTSFLCMFDAKGWKCIITVFLFLPFKNKKIREKQITRKANNNMKVVIGLYENPNASGKNNKTHRFCFTENIFSSIFIHLCLTKIPIHNKQ